MKSVVLYHPPLIDNPNDTLIVEGVIELLKPFKVKIAHCLFGQDLPRGDAVVVCGTPWIFDQCGGSFKINELQRVMDDFDGVKIAVGIGSSFPISVPPSVINQDVEVWRDFDTIAVRDETAVRLLAAYGIPSVQLACPAMLAPCPHYKPYKNKTLLVHTAGAPIPEKVSFDTVIGLTQADADDAYRSGLTQVRLVSNTEVLKKAVLTCSELYSSRVHTCIYKYGQGGVKIHPIVTDTRMNSFTELSDFDTEKQMLEQEV